MCVLQLCSCTAVDTGVGERLSYGPFHAVRIYSQPGAQYLALLLSGDEGWGSPLDAIASRLSSQRTLVAGIDVHDLLSSYARSPQSCVSPGVDLADLAHYLRQRYSLRDVPVVLIGHSAGATLASVALLPER